MLWLTTTLLRSMIFYYSATGNTRFAARYLAAKLSQRAVDILENSDTPRIDGTVGLMFPIYCWGIPPVVSKFIDKLMPEITSDMYIWAACTCGDEAGVAMKKLDRIIKNSRGRGLDAVWSVIMPNTYVLLPGFDVDSPEVEKAKLEAAPGRLDRIAGYIEKHETGIYDVRQGSMPALRSAIFPLFEKWGVSAKRWHVSDACVGCGKCQRICPARNIRLADGRPDWGNRCFSCCACYHCCPEKAISYANFTKGKSQYLCPLV